MKKSFRGFLSLAFACAIAVGSLLVSSVAHVAKTAYVTCRAFKNLLVDGFMAMATKQPAQPEAVAYVRAKEFVLRIAKRERPVVTQSWRMCPST